MMEKPTFTRIVRDHGQFVRRTLSQLGVCARDIADVEQEVFRGVDRGLPAFDPSLSCNPGNAVRGWLYGICERQAASHRRNEARRGEVLSPTEELDVPASSSPDVEQRLIDAERKAILSELLSSLDPHRRAVVVAYELEGVAMNDIAAAHSIPVNTAWNRLRLGRADLRAAWRRVAAQRKLSGIALPLPVLGELVRTAALHAPDAAALSWAQAWAPIEVLKSVFALAKAFVSAKLAAAPASGLIVAGAMTTAAAGGAIYIGVTSRAPAPSQPEMPAALVTAAIAVPPVPRAEPPAEPAPAPSSDTAASADAPAPAAAPSATSRARVAAAPRVPPRDDLLARENELIAGAQTALSSGDLAKARRALEAHERSFCKGRLAPQREVLLLRLLVLEGRHNEARERARQLLDSQPQTLVRTDIEATVGKIDPPSR